MLNRVKKEGVRILVNDITAWSLIVPFITINPTVKAVMRKGAIKQSLFVYP